jgi:mono/diheme cytochrome c family protein
MRNVRFFFPCLGSLSMVVVHAAEPPGKQIFTQHCAECHAPGVGHPGTQRLGWSRGERYAVLEQRKDLSADYVRAIVRHGLLEMPAFRPTEISDEALDQLAAYLARRPIA